MLLAEHSLKKWGRQRGYNLSRPLRICLTLSVQLIVAHYLFFPPAKRNNLDLRFFDNIESSLKDMRAALGSLSG